jgi:hypothetical protein
MRLRVVAVLVILVAALAAVARNSTRDDQTATILQVAKHQETSTASKNTQYDIVLRVQEMIYVVLYKLEDDTKNVEYHVGQNIKVSVGKKTIKFNESAGKTRELLILSSRKALPDA